ncbi:hypothetical protein PPTG_14166 [Phytophthora nicotianae INRA-310]|uniref:Uncharacterized protein n=1 Tax=Phytophthora nicotianae (strain INRA-310) TaxID=761204 RepID=W2PXR3_PHYN3|nr:hypothetical protein PPTG_14166 [Phytophthora nicotianae INRA-310]ETN05426.1 hypothetical protein PPTG_14166 [Phytophthora nicotianae INRA-310]
MGHRAAARGRRPSEEVLLPVLQSSACSNQLEVDAKREWDDHHRRYRRRRHREKFEPLPQLAYVYLPPVFPRYEYHYETRHRHGKTKMYGRQHRRRDYDTIESDEDSSNYNSSDVDDDIPLPLKPTMRSQRMRSLATMSKLQHTAASTIQVLDALSAHLAALHCFAHFFTSSKQAQDFLDVFLLREMISLVPVCLLEVLRETCSAEAAITKRREDFASSLAGNVLVSLIDESIRDVFHDVLQALVKSYLAQKIDLSRAAIPTAVAVATDIFDDWIKELVADLLPEVLVELASEYTENPFELVFQVFLFLKGNNTTSLGATGSSAMVSTAPGSTAGKLAMVSMFSDLDLALDTSGAVVSNANGGRAVA